ncbi:MAG: GNAT family N-acetyltransferase, partial [Gemmatimonadaceae bacterium]
MIALQRVTLEGHGVRLEPLVPAHGDALAAAASDGKLWELWFTSVPTVQEVPAYIALALAGEREGSMLPWAVRELGTGTIVGTTRYHDVAAVMHRVEIGYTW